MSVIQETIQNIYSPPTGLEDKRTIEDKLSPYCMNHAAIPLDTSKNNLWEIFFNQRQSDACKGLIVEEHREKLSLLTYNAQISSSEHEVETNSVGPLLEHQEAFNKLIHDAKDNTFYQNLQGLEKAEALLIEAEALLSAELSTSGTKLYALNAFILANQIRVLVNAREELTDPYIKESEGFKESQAQWLQAAYHWQKVTKQEAPDSILAQSLQVFFVKDGFKKFFNYLASKTSGSQSWLV